MGPAVLLLRNTRPIKEFISEPFWRVSRAPKCHFSPILAGKPLLSRCDYLAISHAKHFETRLFLPEFASRRSDLASINGAHDIETINSAEIPYSSGAYPSGALASIYRGCGRRSQVR